MAKFEQNILYKKYEIQKHKMERLFTNHDFLHIHKILGFGCLTHYGYRIMNRFLYGSMLFENNSMIKYITPAIHLSLSLSSFIFQVPYNRFNSKAIIWKELQLHNIIFTSRSVCMMYHTLFYKEYTRMYYYTRLMIVMIHHYIADVITKKYQIEDKTTTRDIPYDTKNETIKYVAKKYYAISQMLAIFGSLTSINYEDGFLIMFPIQLSTFLMTLVRKNIISNNMWHIIYGMSLSIPYFTNFDKLTEGNHYFYISLCFTISRLVFKMDKYINMIGATNICVLLNENT